MKKAILLLVAFICLMTAVLFGTVTETRSSKTIKGRPIAVRTITATWDNTEGDYTSMAAGDEELLEVYGYIERITINSTTGTNGTADTAFTVSLLDEEDYAIFTKADCNSTDSTYSYMVSLADVGGTLYYAPVPVAGTCSITTENVTQVDEVQTATPDENATAGSYALTYKGETTPQISEVVTISEVNDPCGGTFKLTFDSQQTGALDWDFTAAEIDTALEALSSIPAGGVTCSGGDLPDTAVVVTFSGYLAEQNVGAITFQDVDLEEVTGVSSFALTVTTAGDGLKYNDSTSTVDTALETLTTIGTGGVTVGGNALSAGAMTFTFPAASGNIPMLSGDFDNLGTTASVPITQTAEGGNCLSELEVIIYYRQQPQ